MDREELTSRLAKEYGYPPDGARLIAKRLTVSAPSVQEAFRTWSISGAIPDLAVDGYTVPLLMEQHGMNPIAALLTLDWLLREPDRASDSLRKGHDRVIVERQH